MVKFLRETSSVPELSSIYWHHQPSLNSKKFHYNHDLVSNRCSICATTLFAAFVMEKLSVLVG